MGSGQNLRDCHFFSLKRNRIHITLTYIITFNQQGLNLDRKQTGNRKQMRKKCQRKAYSRNLNKNVGTSLWATLIIRWSEPPFFPAISVCHPTPWSHWDSSRKSSNVQTPAEAGQWLDKSEHFLWAVSGSGWCPPVTQGLSCSATLAHAIISTERQSLSDYLWTPSVLQPGKLALPFLCRQ